jgi:hypothetical protein
VRAILAAFALWTKPTEIERAKLLLLIVFQRTVWTKRAKASIVMGAGRTLRFGVDMEVQAVVTIRASLRSSVVGAFGHSSKVVFV